MCRGRGQPRLPRHKSANSRGGRSSRARPPPTGTTHCRFSRLAAGTFPNRLGIALMDMRFGVWLFTAAMAFGQDYDLVIANGRVMDPAGNVDAVRHLGI